MSTQPHRSVDEEIIVEVVHGAHLRRELEIFCHETIIHRLPHHRLHCCGDATWREVLSFFCLVIGNFFGILSRTTSGQPKCDLFIQNVTKTKFEGFPHGVVLW